jgi:hypothetical protein
MSQESCHLASNKQSLLKYNLVEKELLFFQKYRNLKHHNVQKFVLIENSLVLSGKEYQTLEKSVNYR